MARALSFGILGPVELRVDGTPVPLGGLKPRSVLALLLLEANRVVPSDRLIAELWGATPPETASTALHGYISHLRKLLEPDRTAGAGWEVLVTQAPGYVLRLPAGALDLERFEDGLRYARELLADGDAAAAAAAFRNALDLWRGPPLADLAGEEFAQQAGPPLEELWLTALEDRFDADLAAGDHQRLVPQLEAAIRRHPLRERLRGQLMVALYRSGRQADALAQFATFRQALASELGIEPSGAVRLLEQQILQQDPVLDPPPPPTARARPAPDGAPTAPHRRRRVVLAAGGLGVAGLAVAALLVAFAGDSERPPGPQTTAATQDVTAAAAAAAAPAPPPVSVAGLSPEGLTGVDARTGAVVAAVAVGVHPTSVAVAGQYAWTLDASDRLITRVERSTGTTRRFSTGTVPLDLAADGSAVWVLGADGAAVTRVDASTLAANDPVQLPGRAEPVAGTTTAGATLAIGGDAVWAVTPDLDVVRLDAGGAIDATVPNTEANTISFAEGALWVVTMRQEVLRVDPDRARIDLRIDVPAPSLAAAAVGGGYVWATDPLGGDLWRIDVQSPEPLLHTVPVGIGAAAVAFGEGAVWVANAFDGTLLRIDPRTDETRVVSRFERAPQAVTVADGVVWVTLAEALQRPGEQIGAGAPTCGPVESGGGPPDVVVVGDLPLQGRSRTNAVTLDAAIRRVLAQNAHRAGRFRVGYQTCDSSTPQAGGFEYETCVRNAYAYARTPSVVAEIGPYNSGCARVQIPISGTGGDGPLAMVSPSNSEASLTHDAASSATGTLDRLYPAGERGYVRVYPPDDAQGAAAAVAARRRGWQRVLIATRADGGAYVEDLAAGFERAAAGSGLRVTRLTYGEDTTPTQVRRAARRVDGVFAAGWLDDAGAALLRALRAEGTPSIASDAFISAEERPPSGGGLLVIVPGLPASDVDAVHRELLGALAQERPQGVVPSAYWPAYGIAAAEAVLDAIARSDGSRPSVRDELRRTDLRGPLGALAFTPDGDPRSPPFTLLRVRRGGTGLSGLGPDFEQTDPVLVVRAP